MGSTDDRPDPGFYRVSEVAQLLGRNRQSVYFAIRKGEIPAVKVGKSVLVPKAALWRLVDHALATWEPEQER